MRNMFIMKVVSIILIMSVSQAVNANHDESLIYSAGTEGEPIVFNGIDDFIETPLGILGNSFSVHGHYVLVEDTEEYLASVPFNAVGEVWDTLFTNGVNYCQGLQMMYNREGGFFRFYGNGSCLGIGTINFRLSYDTVTSIAATYNGQVFTLYIDGKKVGEVGYSGSLLQNGTFAVGKDMGINTYFLHGSLSKLGVYDKVLTEQEISELANNPNDKVEPYDIGDFLMFPVDKEVIRELTQGYDISDIPAEIETDIAGYLAKTVASFALDGYSEGTVTNLALAAAQVAYNDNETSMFQQLCGYKYQDDKLTFMPILMAHVKDDYWRYFGYNQVDDRLPVGISLGFNHKLPYGGRADKRIDSIFFSDPEKQAELYDGISSGDMLMIVPKPSILFNANSSETPALLSKLEHNIDAGILIDVTRKFTTKYQFEYSSGLQDSSNEILFTQGLCKFDGVQARIENAYDLIPTKDFKNGGERYVPSGFLENKLDTDTYKFLAKEGERIVIEVKGKPYQSLLMEIVTKDANGTAWVVATNENEVGKMSYVAEENTEHYLIVSAISDESSYLCSEIAFSFSKQCKIPWDYTINMSVGASTKKNK